MTIGATKQKRDSKIETAATTTAIYTPEILRLMARI